MASVLLKHAAYAGIGGFLETKYGPSVQPTGPLGSNPLFVATPLILIGVGFYGLTLGMQVAKARSTSIELAKKDGEKDVDERYGLPNLYAQGTSKHAKAYNAAQRAHQHMFETYTSVALFSLPAAWEFPITAALATLCYAVGRVIFSNNYLASDGDASRRYSSNRLARYMWTGLLVNLFLGAFACVKILASTRLVVQVPE